MYEYLKKNAYCAHLSYPMNPNPRLLPVSGSRMICSVERQDIGSIAARSHTARANERHDSAVGAQAEHIAARARFQTACYLGRLDDNTKCTKCIIQDLFVNLRTPTRVA